MTAAGIVQAVTAALAVQGLPDGDRIASVAAGAALRAAAEVWDAHADRIAAAAVENLGQQWSRGEAVLDARQTAAALRGLAGDVNESCVTGASRGSHAHTGERQAA